MSTYLYHGKLVARNGSGEALRSVLLEASRTVATTKGCRLYALSSDQVNSDIVWVTEIWDSKKDHDNSLKEESVKTVIAKAMPFLNGKPRKGQELYVIGGLGV